MARRSILRSRQNRIGQPQIEGIRAAGFHAASCQQAEKVCEVLIKFLQDQSHDDRKPRSIVREVRMSGHEKHLHRYSTQ
jgi:hypothetical protein